MKKRLAMILAAVMLLAMLPVAAMAADGTTVYLKPTGSWVQNNERYAAYYFGNGDGWVSLTEAGEGVYSAVIPAGYTNVIFCRMNGATTENNWNNKWDQTADLAIPTDNNNCYTIDGSWGPLSGEPVTPPAQTEISYIVAGTPELTGESWNSNSTSNVMTKQADGTYTKVYSLAVGQGYQFKVVAKETGKDDQWIGDATGNNVTFNVTAACDVTITFNPADNSITVTGTGVAFETNLEVGYWAAVGNGSGTWLNGASWDPAAAANKMTGNDGVYSVEFKNVPAGTYEVKFAADGAWTHSFGQTEDGHVLEATELGTALAAVYNGKNIKLSSSYDLADIKLTLDMSNYDHSTKTGATFTVVLTEVETESEDPTTEPTENPTENPTEPEEITEITIYAKVPEDWQNPRVWAWDDNQQNASKEPWPGDIVMTLGEDGWWYATVPAWVQNFIINANNGSYQTADLDIAEMEKDIRITITVDENGIAQPEIEYLNPKTGEGDTMFAVAAALLLAAVGVATTVSAKKKFF